MAYTTINKSSLHMNTKLYTGNGSAGHAITNVGFQPDLTWIKKRSGSSDQILTDVVRGAGYHIKTNDSAAQGYDTNDISSFNADGFTLGVNSRTNGSGATLASWNWKANGAGSANTDGSINSTVSANTTAGFSIVSYTGTGTAGATIGHGLGVAPKMIIIKRTSAAGQWVLGHGSLGFTKFLELDLTGAAQTSTVRFNDTAPTSSVFTVGSTADTNQNGTTLIAYCFADVTGYQKASSYVGNGSSSAPPFIYLGFKPKFIIVKNSSQADSWFMHDDKRDGYNDDNEYLRAETSSVESSGINRIRLLSNGFQVPTTDKSHNVSGNTYVYYAVGQSLVGSSNNVPCTAR